MKIFSVYSLLLVFLCSCYLPRYAYSPAANNVPVLTKKNDSKIGAYYTWNRVKYSGGLDAQAAFAITDHWAVQSAFFNRRETSSRDISLSADSSVIYYKRKSIEAGIGYFRSLNSSKNVFFQVFAGIGRGPTEITDLSFDRAATKAIYNMKVSRIYLQPAFQFLINETFTLSLSSRFSHVRFNDRVTSYTADELDRYQLNYLNKSFLFFEPSITTSIGPDEVPGVKFEVQGGLSGQLTSFPIKNRSLNFSVGVFVDLNRSLGKK